ncbi:MAG: hypothetical protein J6N20_18180, partial [Pseudomonas sp.]|nr:hypothetical protein [Pseudomonas sp.]
MLGQKSAIRPGSIFNRQGGSVFNQRQHQCYASTPTSADDIKRFKALVDENYSLPFEDRRFRNVVWTYGQGELA